MKKRGNKNKRERMKLPLEFQPTKEQLQQGNVVAIFMGRGCIGGIVLEPSKRKTKIQFSNDDIKWVENKRLILVKDIRWIAMAKRGMLGRKRKNDDTGFQQM